MGPAALAKIRRDTAMKTPTESEQKVSMNIQKNEVF